QPEVCASPAAPGTRRAVHVAWHGMWTHPDPPPPFSASWLEAVARLEGLRARRRAADGPTASVSPVDRRGRGSRTGTGAQPDLRAHRSVTHDWTASQATSRIAQVTSTPCDS